MLSLRTSDSLEEAGESVDPRRPLACFLLCGLITPEDLCPRTGGAMDDSLMGGLSEAEAAVYDRQLRVWGVETQKKCAPN